MVSENEKSSLMGHLTIDIISKKTIWWFIFKIAFFMDFVLLMRAIKNKPVYKYFVKGNKKKHVLTTVEGFLKIMSENYPHLVPQYWKNIEL
jgi:hypothetical protein